MTFRGTKYTFSTSDQHICVSILQIQAAHHLTIIIVQLFSDQAPTDLIARISKGYRRVTLEVSTQAMQIDLLEVFLTATLLLQCGRNID
jgi:hypothetical protein